MDMDMDMRGLWTIQLDIGGAPSTISIPYSMLWVGMCTYKGRPRTCVQAELNGIKMANRCRIGRQTGQIYLYPRAANAIGFRAIVRVLLDATRGLWRNVTDRAEDTDTSNRIKSMNPLRTNFDMSKKGTRRNRPAMH